MVLFNVIFFELETLQRSSLAYDRPNKQSYRNVLGKFLKRAWTTQRRARAIRGSGQSNEL